MERGCHLGVPTVLTACVHNLVAVGCDDHIREQWRRMDRFIDNTDQGLSPDLAEHFPRQTSRGQTGRNNGDRFHGLPDYSTPRLVRVEIESGFMPGLVKPDSASTGQRDCGAGAPCSFLELCALNIVFLQRRYECLEIVAHEIENRALQSVSRVLLREGFVGRVKGRFGGRHGKDEPAVADIDMAESEDIAKESSIRLGILAVKKNMRPGNHRQSIRGTSCPYV